MIESQRHSYHLVDPSPWPISGSLGALATTVGGVMYMHSFQGGATLLSLGLIFILYTMFVWWRDVLRESTLEGHHTKVVQLGPRYGFILFIVSEVMFFFAFFRASSHSSLAPTVEIGGIWPPKGIGVLDPWEIPFLNTLIPPSSGAAVTWAHHAILAGKEKRAVYALVATVLLALVFTGFQGMEYYQAPSTISDSIYGSTFFLATGFHGFHVIIGTLFLIICGIRQYLGHLTKEHHVGFEAAAWYWHFVDVVWLFPFVSIYWWGDYIDPGDFTSLRFVCIVDQTSPLLLVEIFEPRIYSRASSNLSFLNKSKNLMDRTHPQCNLSSPGLKKASKSLYLLVETHFVLLLGLKFQESDLSNPKLPNQIAADCKHIPMDLCHQKQPPQQVYQPAQILPSNFQLRHLDQKHVSKPGLLSPRSPPRNPHQLHLHFLTSCSDYEGNGFQSITRDPHSYVDITKGSSSLLLSQQGSDHRYIAGYPSKTNKKTDETFLPARTLARTLAGLLSFTQAAIAKPLATHHRTDWPVHQDIDLQGLKMPYHTAPEDIIYIYTSLLTNRADTDKSKTASRALFTFAN
ncbi:cytochrome c oxidase subunit 3 [Striga asiatica]|uniref:Cytochrome c oxidase subunit 3 n=2 Tax=Lamiales TaxID=4143 RepID=A0A5A7R0C5_STRAF|nr:cytochrome c oxidase subunit 3 [Striga asiatica]